MERGTFKAQTGHASNNQASHKYHRNTILPSDTSEGLVWSKRPGSVHTAAGVAWQKAAGKGGTSAEGAAHFGPPQEWPGGRQPAAASYSDY